MSVLKSILDAIAAKETAAAPKIGPHTLKAYKRKLPKREEQLDDPYQVTVSGAEVPDSVELMSFGRKYRVRYKVEVTLVTPNDHDALTNLDAHTDWREACRARYMVPDPLPGLGVQWVGVTTGAMLDRGQLADGYDYDQLILEVLTYETRA